MMEPFENTSRTGKKWHCFQLDLVLIVILLCSCFPQIGSLSLKPPAEEILNTHLCPDPVIARGSSKSHANFDSSKIMAISLERSAKPKDRTNSYFSRFRPCTFTEDSDNTLLGALFGDENNPNATQIRIKSINLNTEAWNFSSAAECTKFIMFKSWADYGNGYPVMCGRDNFDQYLGPYGHPMILYYHLKDQGIAFPLFHPNYGQNSRDQKDVLELKYMLIYYSIKKNGLRTCRLQQYVLDPLHQGCPATDTNCGEYDCTELETLYQKKMGIIRNGDHHQQRFIIVKSKTQEKYRVRNFLRQKFVPIVFLLVLIFAYKSYMKAGLRLNDPLPLQVSEMRLRRYQQRQSHHLHHHHAHDPRPYMSSSGGDHFRDIYFEYGSEHIPGLHIPYEPTPPITPVDPLPDDTAAQQQCPPNNSRAKLGHGVGDPPPSYESLFPPTYNEATGVPKNPKV